jgi:hypothetical protein
MQQPRAGCFVVYVDCRYAKQRVFNAMVQRASDDYADLLVFTPDGPVARAAVPPHCAYHKQRAYWVWPPPLPPAAGRLDQRRITRKTLRS